MLIDIVAKLLLSHNCTYNIDYEQIITHKYNL